MTRELTLDSPTRQFRSCRDCIQVTIATHLVRRGVAARIERWLSARLLRPVYERELELLRGVATAMGR